MFIDCFGHVSKFVRVLNPYLRVFPGTTKAQRDIIPGANRDHFFPRKRRIEFEKSNE